MAVRAAQPHVRSVTSLVTLRGGVGVGKVTARERHQALNRA
jgi:hypothetical protein